MDILIHVYGGIVQNVFRIPGSEETNRVFLVDYDNESKPEISQVTLENLAGDVGKDFRRWRMSLTKKLQEGDSPLLKKLVEFHDAVLDGFERGRHGHNDWQQKVVDISDDIQDDVDLSEWRKS